MARPYQKHGIEELEALVKAFKHSRAVLGDIREELTYRRTDRAKALLRDVTGPLTGVVPMPRRPRRPDSPDDQLSFLSPARSTRRNARL